MAGKNSKNRKPTKEETKTANRNRAAQIMFAVFAILLILSMVLSAVAKF